MGQMQRNCWLCQQKMDKGDPDNIRHVPDSKRETLCEPCAKMTDDFQGEQSVTKDWARKPIPIGPWRRQYAATTRGGWSLGKDSLNQAIKDALKASGFADDVILSVCSYETRSKNHISGVHFEFYHPRFVEGDEDIVRNLVYIM